MIQINPFICRRDEIPASTDDGTYCVLLNSLNTTFVQTKK